MPQVDLHTLLELVGDLDDSIEPGSPSERFRKYLNGNIQQVNDVRAYVNDALTQSGDQYNKALQDLINHIGHLLGFEVEYGRYRGVKGSIGFDGLWQSKTGWSIVVESKTTDVYTVKTAPLLGYINSLVSEGRIKGPANAIGLYVYGRFDAQTNQLENAITVEGRREGLRVVSVDALLNLLELKQEYNLAHDTVLGLLLPAPVKIDALVNLIFDIVAQEKEEGDIAYEEEEKKTPAEEAPAASAILGKQRQIGTRVSLVALEEDYTGKTAKSVIFLNRQYKVHTWKEAALMMFEALRRKDQRRFEDVSVTVFGRKRPYIAYDKDQLRTPEIIPGTDLYFETNLGANSIAKLCYTLVLEMGYKKTDFQLEAET
jgi:hypothetical protein